jgi:hypothetical protein
MPQLAWFCYAPLADFYSAVDSNGFDQQIQLGASGSRRVTNISSSWARFNSKPPSNKEERYARILWTLSLDN